MIRVYTHKHHGSFDTVADGLVYGFSKLGVLAGQCNLDKDEDAVPGGTAKHAIVVGNPFGAQMVHLRGMHEESWLLHAPNSEGLPKHIRDYLTSEIFSLRADKKVPVVSGLFGPSKWAVDVLRQQCPGVPVRLLRHGVLPGFQSDLDARKKVLEDFEQHFRVLHATSTGSDRKGTKLLLQAWALFEKVMPRATLAVLCHVSMMPAMQDFAVKQGCRRVHFGANHGMPEPSWVRVLNHTHVVVQPSRGEGFGLIPLEARACGVPVVATACTGHSEHMDEGPGRVIIPTGDLEESDDYLGAKTPSVSVEAIYEALMTMYRNYQEHYFAALGDAPVVGGKWAWDRVLAEDLEETPWLTIDPRT